MSPYRPHRPDEGDRLELVCSLYPLQVMPSYPRNLILSDCSYFHITWQCHNRSWLLKERWAKRLYYDLLLKFKSEYGVQIFSYNLMDSHPHLTGYAETQVGLSNFMKRVNGIFARTYNRQCKRRGQVVMDRFRSPQIQSDRHLLNVMIYIDMNPVRAKIVIHPCDYEWTSYPFYAEGVADPLITPAPSYLGLAETAMRRQTIYRKLVEGLINTGVVKQHYSSMYFIGNTDWVISKYHALVKIRKNHTLQNKVPSKILSSA